MVGCVETDFNKIKHISLFVNGFFVENSSQRQFGGQSGKKCRRDWFSRTFDRSIRLELSERPVLTYIPLFTHKKSLPRGKPTKKS